MRLILVAIFLILYGIFTIPMCLVEWVAGKISPIKKAVIAQKCVAAGFKIILFISGVKLTVKGEENILHNVQRFIHITIEDFLIYLLVMRQRHYVHHMCQRKRLKLCQ